MSIHEYDFQLKLKESDGISATKSVEDIILGNIPGALSVTRAHAVNDRTGTDFWCEHSSGRHLSVDTKIRQTDWIERGQDDLALETWSVVEKQIPGWTRDPKKRADFILWFWSDSGRWCMIPFPMLCAVFQNKWQKWKNTYQTNKQHTPGNNGGYHSECVFVPREIIWREIYRKFSGVPPLTTQKAR